MWKQERQVTVFVCQGSADLAWREPFDRLLAQCRSRWPNQLFRLAFCERMAPGLTEVLDELAIDLCDHIGVVVLDLPTDDAAAQTLSRALADASRRWPELRVERHDRSLADPDLLDAIGCAAIDSATIDSATIGCTATGCTATV